MAIASEVITPVRDLLLDLSSTGYRWTDAELLRYLTLGQREICGPFPDANTKSAVITPGASDVRIDLETKLTASGTKPIALTRVEGGMDEVGGVEGYSINVIEKHVMDSLNPSWMNYVPVAANYLNKALNRRYYQAVVLDPKDGLAFWLYPRANPDFRVVVSYTAVPADVTTTGSTLDLPDQYVPALIDYVVYRALAKDSVYTGAPNKSREYLQDFMTKLGLGTKAAEEANPTAARAPEEH
jgi:hypothetical protein